MSPESITGLIKSMDVKPLTEENFEEFINRIKEMFSSEGSVFKRYFEDSNDNVSEVFNIDSRCGFQSKFKNLKVRNDSNCTNGSVDIHFDDFYLDTVVGYWKDQPISTFGFIDGKAFYFTEPSSSGKNTLRVMYLKVN